MDPGLVDALVKNGLGGIVVMVIIGGWLVPSRFYRRLEEENRLLREALDLERERSAEAAATASTTNRLIEALTDLAAEKRGLPSPGRDHGSGE